MCVWEREREVPGARSKRPPSWGTEPSGSSRSEKGCLHRFDTRTDECSTCVIIQSLYTLVAHNSVTLHSVASLYSLVAS